MDIRSEFSLFENELNRLIKEYELYFSGINKTPPNDIKKKVDNLARKLRQSHITSTVNKFKLRGLISRYNSYNQYWESIMRKIEEGIFWRDKGIPTFVPPSVKPVSVPPDEEEAADQGSEAQGSQEERDIAHYLGIYRDYIMAKKSIGEEIGGMTFEKMVETLQNREADLKKKFNVDQVDFAVDIEDSLVKIKSITKK